MTSSQLLKCRAVDDLDAKLEKIVEWIKEWIKLEQHLNSNKVIDWEGSSRLIREFQPRP